MDDLRQAHGTHTWDIVIEYCKCPKCGYIFENRDKYDYRLGLYQKDLICSDCRHTYTITKQMRPSFGPLLGDPQQAN